MAFLLVAECGLRWGWGFGTPVLYEWDRRFEYRMAPNQSVRRFGKRIETNALGLRCRPFDSSRSDPNEFRVLVLGDSVVNGGSHVDQSELGTALLERALADRLGRPVLVVNASANSWGPPNEQAFIEAFGTFDADVVFLVLSSHDLVDIPDHAAESRSGSGNSFNRPWCALSEVAGMAWARLIPAAVPSPPDEADEARSVESRASLRALLSTLAAHTQRVAVGFHWDRDEQAKGEPRHAHDVLASDVAAMRVPSWDLGPAFVKAAGAGTPVMHDRIHPTAQGQAVLAAELLRQMDERGWMGAVAALPDRSR